MDLRDYQSEIIDRLRQTMKQLVSARKPPRVLLQLPTGAGKTVVASALIQAAHAKGSNTLFVAHRSELIYQTSDKLNRFGVPHGLIIPGESRPLGHRVFVGTIQSVTSRANRGRADYSDLQFIFVDEAHRSNATTYKRLIDTYPDAFVVGLTATPIRGDGRGLGSVYSELIQGPTIDQLTALGHLVPVRYFAPESYDLTNVRTLAGDYREDDLEKAVNKAELVGNIVEHYQRIGIGRKAVVFATSVKHSMAIAQRFIDCGYAAAHIDGETPMAERKQILHDLSTGKLSVVCNCMILTEGWDQPDVSCIILARPTKSIGLYMQIAGRALRPWEGKQDCILIDHTGTVNRLGAVNEYDHWQLKADKPGEGVERVAAEKLDKTCPECHMVMRPAKFCPNCGHEFVSTRKPGELLESDEDLVELTAIGKKKGKSEHTMLQKRMWYAQLLGYAEERGYREGWAYHQYKVKFGVYPNAKPDPVAPTPAVRSWIKAQQIRHAKGKAKSDSNRLYGTTAWWNRPNKGAVQ